MRRVVLALLALSAGLPAAAQGVRKTADEFNRMSRSDTSLVVLHGVVTRPRANDQRGVFYLQDETGEAYIYGLEDGRPGMNQSFVQMGIAPGDTLTVSGEILESMKAPDKYPTFKGQDANAFSSWVTARLKYPQDAKDARIEGTVLVKFVIGTNGGVQEVEVEKGVFPSLDAEAVRVIKSSPKWKPGIKDGKPVRVTYHHPVIFVLPN